MSGMPSSKGGRRLRRFLVSGRQSLTEKRSILRGSRRRASLTLASFLEAGQSVDHAPGHGLLNDRAEVAVKRLTQVFEHVVHSLESRKCRERFPGGTRVFSSHFRWSAEPIGPQRTFASATARRRRRFPAEAIEIEERQERREICARLNKALRRTPGSTSREASLLRRDRSG